MVYLCIEPQTQSQNRPPLSWLTTAASAPCCKNNTVLQFYKENGWILCWKLGIIYILKQSLAAALKERPLKKVETHWFHFININDIAFYQTILLSEIKFYWPFFILYFTSVFIQYLAIDKDYVNCLTHFSFTLEKFSEFFFIIPFEDFRIFILSQFNV